MKAKAGKIIYLDCFIIFLILFIVSMAAIKMGFIRSLIAAIGLTMGIYYLLCLRFIGYVLWAGFAALYASFIVAIPLITHFTEKSRVLAVIVYLAAFVLMFWAHFHVQFKDKFRPLDARRNQRSLYGDEMISQVENSVSAYNKLSLIDLYAVFKYCRERLYSNYIGQLMEICNWYEGDSRYQTVWDQAHEVAQPIVDAWTELIDIMHDADTKKISNKERKKAVKLLKEAVDTSIATKPALEDYIYGMQILINQETAQRREKEERYYRQAESQRQSTGSSDYSDFFSGCTDADSVKKRYRDLLKIYHPDNQNGDTSMSQKLQDAYEAQMRRYS